MAVQTSVLLTDDLDGSVAKHTVEFGLDGENYLIDLSDTNAYRLREVFKGYIAAARPAPVAKKAKSGSNGTSETQAIRTWASANGFEVKSRGRIPAEIVEKYRANQGADQGAEQSVSV